MVTPISFGGLISGLDTQKLIQQLTAIEARPISLLTKQKSTLQSQFDAFKDLNTRLASLEEKAFSLTQFSNVFARKATPADANILNVTADSSASIGSFSVNVLQLATATTRQTAAGAGQGNNNGGIANLGNFSAETFSQINTNNRLKGQVTDGTFFVNGQQINVTGAKTLTQIFTDINTATGGTVTGSLILDPAKEGLVVRLASAGPITVSNGTSNFLSLTNLDTATFGAGELRSTDAVNGVRTDLKLDGSAGAVNISQAVGSGTLSINGIGVTYNASADTLNDIINRINASNTGVTAAFSSAGSGSVILTNTQAGPTGITVSDTGNLATALGFNAPTSQTLGQSAQIQINGGGTQSFTTNSGISPSGVSGITLALKSTGVTNVTVNADTDVLVNKAKDFVSQYNSVIDKINELTKYDPVTQESGILLADSTVAGIRARADKLLFGTVSGLSQGSYTGSLSELGFSTGPVGSAVGTTTDLQLDESKLRSALENSPTRVGQLLGALATTDGSNGAFQRVKNYFDSFSNSTGILAEKQKSTNSQIQSIDKRISALNSQVDFRKQLLESQFVNLEKSLAGLQSQYNSLGSLFALFQPFENF